MNRKARRFCIKSFARGQKSVVVRVLFLLTLLIAQVSAWNIVSTVSTPVLSAGVTCVVSNEQSTVFIAGTKKGGLIVSKKNASIDDSKDELIFNEISWEAFPRDAYSPKFPIYSMDYDNESGLLFAGAGDRFISVWSQLGKDETPSFRFRTTLGPHTGWVKSVVFHKSSQTLFSIGCNCIESWDCSGDDPSFSHLSKRSIENSPELGSTLSSDLLSLCLIERRGLLLSGGVDGRILAWHLDPSKIDSIFELRCHHGRVNAITTWFVDKDDCSPLVLSVGHDGRIAILKLASSSFDLITEMKLSGSPRLSSMCMVETFSDGSCTLAIGTTGGKIFIVRAQCHEDKVDLNEIESHTLNGEPMIYSIATFRSMNSMQLLIGHGKGMDVLQYDKLQL